jgi:predicted nucleotidyltransferase
LQAFGFGSVELGVADLTQSDRVIRLGYPPSRIDILTSIEGVAFDEAWERSAIRQVDGVEIRVISLEDLIRNKRAMGRRLDLDDLEHLGAT